VARTTKADRREEYLDIGAQLVAESGQAGAHQPALALAHVRIADVAARAGVTKGALYHLWDSQHAYWEDLLEYLLATQGTQGAAEIAALVDGLGGRDPVDVVAYANATFDSFSADPSFFVRIALTSYLGTGEERDPFDSRVREGMDRFAPILDEVLAGLGWRWRSGVAPRHYMTAVAALLQGLAIYDRVAPNGAPEFLDADGRRVTLYACATEALLRGCARSDGAPAIERPTAVRRRPPWARLEIDPDAGPDPSPDEAPVLVDAAPVTRRGRPTLEQRRLDYLRTGAEIAMDLDRSGRGGAVDALVNIRLADVAERAGVTKGALYHVWDDQDAFRADLLAHLLDVDERHGMADTEVAIRRLAVELRRGPEGPDLAQVIRHMTGFAFDRLKDDPVHAARFAFATHLHHPGVRRPLARTTDAYLRHYEGLLELSGRRVRAPFTVRDLSAVVNASMEGLLLRYRTSPDLADSVIDTMHPDDDGGWHRDPWRIAAYAAFTYVTWFTEPDR
jgi:AcrR family transcriptional regulator